MLEDLDLTFYTNRCRHQATQGMPACCKAGVRYAELVPESLGRMLRLPCFITARSHDVVPCEKLSRYTREEAIAERDSMDRAVKAVFAGKSPCCGAELTKRESVGVTVCSCSECGKFVMRECRGIGALP